MNQENAWKWIVAGAAIVTVGGTIGVAMMLNSPSATPSASTVKKTPTETVATPTPIETPTERTDAPFVITTMTHMEGNFGDNDNKALFLKHVATMRWAMDLFDEYGAKLTFESEQPFAKANTTWGLNIMKEVVDSGHGVGTHADFGAAAGTTLTLDELTTEFKTNKALVDGLVGAENNQGVSGGTGPTDWVLAASAAGFTYFDAVTGFGYLSMPMSVRPNGWNDNYIRHVTYHDSIPLNLTDRIYPIPLKDANDLIADANPAISVMSGDIGELASIAEGRSTCNPDCTFDQADIDAIMAAIDEANASRDTSRFAKINFHIPLTLLTPANETLLRNMLAAIKKYTDNGTLAWDTMLGSYKQYVEWSE
ncbi:MAG: hypothetical protein AAB473_00775 [Patescibacteria group bacterium]